MEELTLERDIERYLTVRCKKAGLLTLKFTSPSNAGVPDRMILVPGGKPVFVELKRPKEKLRPLQRKRVETLSSLGYTVAVVSDKPGVSKLVEQIADDVLREILAHEG